ncbi:epithelial cell transforming 2 pebble isoform X4 [Rhynchophorus ferrugineus]|uniref:epithelial cell transforming 2 pebble isoform X4 n=1 Tax=Rhynchophorus ferrugineus TaxID=354439 RepID=UPI003FCE59BD
MDENNAKIYTQGSICSDSNGEETFKNDESLFADRRICLIGNLAEDNKLHSVAESFGVPVVCSENGLEYVNDNACCTYYVIDTFDGDIYNALSKSRQIILGPPALQQLAKNEKKELPDNTRPLFNIAMRGVVVCFTGFRCKDELIKLIPLIHHMGGSIRKHMTAKVTHLIANKCGGEKYQYASTFKLPVMNLQWVIDSWDHRCELDFNASVDTFISNYKLKPFYGARVCFLGFPEDEENHMREVLLSNGGTVASADDSTCTHVVVDESSVAERPDVAKAFVIKAEWFWTSVQKEYSLDEKEYLFDDYIEHAAITSPGVRRESQTATPSSTSRRKRKRIQETVKLLLQQSQSPATHKRRSSVSDAGLLSVSGSFLDCTASPNDKALLDKAESKEAPQITSARHQVFLELVQTESNYVEILSIIVKLFKQYLEEMLDEDPLLNNTELNLIFGKLPPIHETHVKMLDELRWTKAHWSEERSIGDVIIKYSTELQRAYPPFINYFEEMKEVLTKCDQSKPRFHAFLKAMQTRPECGRQSLQELMIRPVQRLGSISLLLNDLLKHTTKNNPDHGALDRALAALREVMTHINEDKRKTEGQVTLFNIFNDIDNCPPDIVSSHRSYITKVEVTQLGSSEGLSSKGSNLVLFLFSDQLEVCKKKSKAFNSMKSPSASVSSFQLQGKTVVKPYKHVKMMALNTIKRVIDIKETEDCQKVFSLVCRGNDDLKEKLFSFAVTDDDVDKVDFLKSLTRTMANNVCCADAEKFMAYLEPQQLDIDTSDLSTNTLTKAFKFAKTRLKVGRTFSFNKSTPSKLKRAVSSMMSPFGSSTNLTPASQLANMRLASYSNINELGSNAENSDEPPPVAPMSVQPTRKVKSSSLNVNTFKRL